jgi:hypothetical protein
VMQLWNDRMGGAQNCALTRPKRWVQGRHTMLLRVCRRPVAVSPPFRLPRARPGSGTAGSLALLRQQVAGKWACSCAGGNDASQWLPSGVRICSMFYAYSGPQPILSRFLHPRSRRIRRELPSRVEAGFNTQMNAVAVEIASKPAGMRPAVRGRCRRGREPGRVARSVGRRSPHGPRPAGCQLA